MARSGAPSAPAATSTARPPTPARTGRRARAPGRRAPAGAPAPSPRSTARRRASRPPGSARTTAVPSPPVPPVISAVRSMSAAVLRTRHTLHGRLELVRRQLYLRAHVRAGARGRPDRRPGAHRPRARDAPQARRRVVSQARPGRPHGHAAGRALGRRRRRVAAPRSPAAPVRVAGRYAVHPRYGPQLTVQALRAAPSRTSTPPTTCSTGPRARAAALEADLRELVATVRNPHLHRLLERLLGERAPTLGRVPRRARRPSTTTRPTATACSSTRSASPTASTRSARPSRRSTATWRSPARCCTTSASSTPTPSRAAPSTSPTPASSRARSRSATTACAARSRSIDGFPAALGRGRAAHHPLPPRRARARQPGRPVHARGHARAHDRQPRRPARLLRPAREGARRRRAAGRGTTARSRARPTSSREAAVSSQAPVAGSPSAARTAAESTMLSNLTR